MHSICWPYPYNVQKSWSVRNLQVHHHHSDTYPKIWNNCAFKSHNSTFISGSKIIVVSCHFTWDQILIIAVIWYLKWYLIWHLMQFWNMAYNFHSTCWRASSLKYQFWIEICYYITWHVNFWIVLFILKITFECGLLFTTMSLQKCNTLLLWPVDGVTKLLHVLSQFSNVTTTKPCYIFSV